MEFPSRSGGAQGGLIKGNLFAQSGAPVFSHTKHWDSVIHTVNGRISITRDKQETPQPYLLLPYYRNGRPRLFSAGGCAAFASRSKIAGLAIKALAGARGLPGRPACELRRLRRPRWARSPDEGCSR